MLRKLQINRDIRLEVGLLVWVLFESKTWTPALIIDRNQHKSKIVLQKHHNIPKPTNTNFMVQYVLEKSVSVFESECICDYTNNMHLVHHPGKPRRDIVQACVDANRYLSTDPNAISSQVKRFHALEPFEQYIKRIFRNPGRSECGKRRHGDAIGEVNNMYEKRSRISRDGSSQHRRKDESSNKLKLRTHASNTVVKDGNSQKEAELAVAQGELCKMRKDLVTQVAKEGEWRRQIEKMQSEINSRRAKEDMMGRAMEKMKLHLTSEIAKKEAESKGLEHDKRALKENERALWKKMDKMRYELEDVKSKRENDRKDLKRMEEERNISLDEMEHELRRMDGVKMELRAKEEEMRHLEDIHNVELDELKREADELKRELKKKREDKYKLLGKLDKERDDRKKETKKKREEKFWLQDQLEFEREKWEDKLKKKQHEMEKVEGLLRLERDEVMILKKELEGERRKICVKEEPALVAEEDKVELEMRRAKEEVLEHKSMLEAQEKKLAELQREVMMEREKRKVQENIVNTFLDQKNTIDSLKHQLNTS